VLGATAVTHRSSHGSEEPVGRQGCLFRLPGEGSVEAWIRAGWRLGSTGNDCCLFVAKYSNDARKLGEDKGEVKEKGEDNDI